jgi:adenylate kinase family enzyme
MIEIKRLRSAFPHLPPGGPPERWASQVVRFAILGNSGSGKSTLASALVSFHAIPSLDLDTVAWVPGTVGVPREHADTAKDVQTFCARNESFLIEGCYEGLIAASFPYQPRLIFLDVGPDVCERHCRARPFESHKYDSPAAQNEKLEFLLQWIRDYYTRQGPMSRTEHIKLYDSYAGPKSRYVAQVTLSKAGDILVNA